jgi:hypothetical protein
MGDSEDVDLNLAINDVTWVLDKMTLVLKQTEKSTSMKHSLDSVIEDVKKR